MELKVQVKKPRPHKLSQNKLPIYLNFTEKSYILTYEIKIWINKIYQTVKLVAPQRIHEFLYLYNNFYCKNEFGYYPACTVVLQQRKNEVGYYPACTVVLQQRHSNVISNCFICSTFKFYLQRCSNITELLQKDVIVTW